MAEQSSSAIEVKYTLGDLYAITFQSWRRHLLSIAILPVVIFVFLVLLVAIDGSNLIDTLAVFPWEFLVSLIGLLLALRFGLAPLLAYLGGRRVAEAGHNYFELSQEGVRVRSSDVNALIFWSGFKRVEETGNRLFLFTDPTGGFVLPLRAFPDRAAFDAAVTHAKIEWAAAAKK